MLFIDTSNIFNILLYLFVSVVVVGRRARVCFFGRDVSLSPWRRLHLFSARVLLRPSLNAQIHFACGGARVYLRVCVSVRYNTSNARQAGKTSKRARERAAECERAGERALYSVWFDSNLFEATAQHLWLGNMLSIAWQHAVCKLATCTMLP